MNENTSANLPLPNNKCPSLRIQDVYFQAIFNTNQNKPENYDKLVKILGNKTKRNNNNDYSEEKDSKRIKGSDKGIIIREAVRYLNQNDNNKQKEKEEAGGKEDKIMNNTYNSILIPHLLRGKNISK